MDTMLEDDLLTFWKDCYRDALKELVRTQGLDGLLLSPRIAAIASSLAQESLKQYAKKILPACSVCGGDGSVMRDDAPSICDACRGLGVERPKLEAERPMGRIASLPGV